MHLQFLTIWLILRCSSSSRIKDEAHFINNFISISFECLILRVWNWSGHAAEEISKAFCKPRMVMAVIWCTRLRRTWSLLDTHDADSFVKKRSDYLGFFVLLGSLQQWRQGNATSSHFRKKNENLMLKPRCHAWQCFADSVPTAILDVDSMTEKVVATFNMPIIVNRHEALIAHLRN